MLSARVAVAGAFVVWLTGCGGEPRGGCVAGATRCTGEVREACVDRAFTAVETCAGVCDDTLGCVACRPGQATCAGDVSTYCRPDGSGMATETCDGVQAVSCNAASGRCAGPCAPSVLGRSYIGCEYFPVVTSNLVDDSFRFGVAIANASAVTAQVTIEGGELAQPITFGVDAGSVRLEELPWVALLKDRTSALVHGGAYHLRATQPVTVYQFNPTEFKRGSNHSFSNDASLLLPSNAWGRDYLVATYQHYVLPGFVSVTAVEDGTEVSLALRAPARADHGAPEVAAGEPVTVTLDRGDVLQIANRDGDLTGSRIGATRPVQVLGGHNCIMVPTRLSACDHLEESMFPVETLSRTYLVAAPAVPALPHGKVEVVRIIAATARTTLSFDPPQPGVPTSLARAGDFVEIELTDATFQVSADRKILVAQYMTGQQAGGDMGDPAMSLAVATDQYRREYLFHAPLTYDTNYVNVTAPVAAIVVLDGNLVTGFEPIGGTGFALARVVLDDGIGGNHHITGDQPFGISVYGYGSFTSYWYPGGTELRDIVL